MNTNLAATKNITPNVPTEEKKGNLFSLPNIFIKKFSQRMAPPKGESALDYLLYEDTIRGKDVLGIEHFSKEELELVLASAIKLKKNKFDETQTKLAKGQSLAMLFEKPSLRTRFTFEAGMTQLGGHAINMEAQLGKREPVFDIAKNLDRWVDGIMARTFSHETIVELMDNADVPVINGLSDKEHPCQAFADYMTILEHKKSFEDLKITYIGDSNNVANSLMLFASKIGIDFVIACPSTYCPDSDILSKATEAATVSGAKISIVHEPVGAAYKSDVIYTDTWVSMGQEEDDAIRKQAFSRFTVDNTIMNAAKPDAIVMHCLPAHRGQEVTSEVLDGPQSVIYDQAENRLHAQKAIISLVL